MLCKKSRLGKVLHTVIQGFGEGLDKGAAARRAGLVELYAVHGAVLNLDTFHVLTADVQDAVHLRIEEGSGIIVGYRFHFPVIQQEGSLHQSLTVTCGAGAYNIDPFGQAFIDFFQGADGGLQRTAVVIAVKRVEQGAVFPDQRNLCGGRAGINAKERIALIRLKSRSFDMVRIVTLTECLISLPVCKKRLHTFHFEFHFNLRRELGYHLFQSKACHRLTAGKLFIGSDCGGFCIQRRTDGGEKVGIGGINHVFLV